MKTFKAILSDSTPYERSTVWLIIISKDLKRATELAEEQSNLYKVKILSIKEIKNDVEHIEVIGEHYD